MNRANVEPLHIERHGPADATPVVLVHGAPDRSSAFRQVVPHLEGLRVAVYDRRGYDRSRAAPPPTGMRDHAEDLLAIVDDMGTPGVVVAHSFASNIALLATTIRPDAFAAVGVWEPPMPWVDWWPTVVRNTAAEIAASGDAAGALEAMYRRLMGDDGWDALPASVQERRRGDGVAFSVDMASELEQPYAFDDVRVPVLLGYGTATSDFHLRGARFMGEQLPDCRLHAVEGAAHFAHRTHPAEFAGFVRATVMLASSTA